MTNELFASTPMNINKRPVIVGVSGGTGPGKTTVVTGIYNSLYPDDVLIIQHDSYYNDRSHLTNEKRANINYDHPDAFETSLLVKQLMQLSIGKQ